MTIMTNAIQLKRSVVALVTIVAFAVTSFPAFGQDINSMSTAQLMALLNNLQAQIGATKSTSGVSSQVVASSNAACPYVWSRNMGVGSRGEDVRRLQQFLNSDAQTSVAKTGVGSPSKETTYYGLGTSRAIVRFQDKYASEVLTPIGLSKGTGYFGSGTRAKANALCKTASTQVVNTGVGKTSTQLQILVPEGGVVVSKGKIITNGDALAGAQNVPFTAFSITAGSESILVKSIKVRRTGLSSNKMFESVAVIDSSSLQVGSSRRLNSDSEATINTRFAVPRRSTVELTVVGNIADEDDIKSGERARLEIISIDAEGTVVGLESPIVGATHEASDAVTLAIVEVKSLWSESSTDTLEVGEEDVDLGRYRVSLKSSEEDVYLKLVTFEQNGTMDLDDIRDLVVEIDGKKEYKTTMNGDNLSVSFPGKGLLIEERDSIKLNIKGSPKSGSDETIQFTIDDESDVVAVGADYGYGLAANIDKAEGKKFTVEKGSASSKTARRSSSDREITHGDGKEIGVFRFDLEEETEFEELSFTFEFKGLDTEALEIFWDEAEEVALDNIELRDENDNVLASLDDDILLEMSRKTAFDSSTTTGLKDGGGSSLPNIETEELTSSDVFTLEKGDHTLYLFADLDKGWKDEGLSIEATIVKVDEITSLDSDEKWTSSERSDFVGTNGIKGKEYNIKGSNIEITLRSVGNGSAVNGSEGQEFVEIEIDAEDATDDVELDTLVLGAKAEASTGRSSIEDLIDCRVIDNNDEEISDSVDLTEDSYSSSTSTADFVEFDLDSYIVKKGKEVDLKVVCDIEDPVDNKENDPKFFFFVDNSSAGTHYLEYSIDGDDDTIDIADRSNYGKIVVGDELDVDVSKKIDGGSARVVAVGDDNNDFVKVGYLKIESNNEDIEIKTIELSFDGDENGKVGNINLSSGDGKVSAVSEYVREVEIRIGNDVISSESSINSSGDMVINDIDEILKQDKRTEVEVWVSLEGIDKNSETVSGVSIHPKIKRVEFEGESTGAVESDTKVSELQVLYMFRAAPIFEVEESSRENLNRGSSTETIHKFKVTADGDDLSLNQVSVKIDTTDESDLGKDADDNPVEGSVKDMLVKNVKIYAYTNKDRTDDASTGNPKGQLNTGDNIGLKDSEVTGTKNHSVELLFDRPLDIDEGDTVWFTVKAEFEGVKNDDSVTITMITDEVDHARKHKKAKLPSSGDPTFSVIWTPKSSGKMSLGDDNKDWFNGFEVLDTEEADNKFRLDEDN